MINESIVKECIDLINDYFSKDNYKTILWFNINNPLLGNISSYD